MAKVGMDVEVVKSIGRDLGKAASDIETVTNTIGKLLGRADQNWEGKDAEHFKQLWNGTYLGQLRKIRQEIDDLGKSATKNADEQERISGSY